MAYAVQHARVPLCITDPKLPDNPIVYANSSFFDLVGYTEDDVIGKNCRFLQGPDTAEESIAAVRLAIVERRVETVEILNYRKDGSSFLNALQIGPIYDDDGALLYYFGSQLDITAKRIQEQKARELADAELLHRLRNIVNVMTVVIRHTMREEYDAQTLGRIVSERLRALSDAHFSTIIQPEDQNLTFAELSKTILSAYAPLGPRQFRLDGPEVVLPRPLLSCLALGLHELATNSVKHGSLGEMDGSVELNWEVNASGTQLSMCWSERGGPAVVKPMRQSGSKIVLDLVTAVNGSIDFNWRETGLIVEAVFPL
ncbi:Blue-light-activated histidine kinase 1 [Flavimaricola marinus]|uniref:histidine kinase n=2 Tax=Flavimaricola marinus TaxID=1819565 RepID=A0A238L974_9RHOB|nr:Blue-light-activated histidine kinase 1 [Flavimaricola marinus]